MIQFSMLIYVLNFTFVQFDVFIWFIIILKVFDVLILFCFYGVGLKAEMEALWDLFIALGKVSAYQILLLL